jgi:hypothetical protein
MKLLAIEIAAMIGIEVGHTKPVLVRRFNLALECKYAGRALEGFDLNVGHWESIISRAAVAINTGGSVDAETLKSWAQL